VNFDGAKLALRASKKRDHACETRKKRHGKGVLAMLWVHLFRGRVYDAGVASRGGMGAEIDSSKAGGTIQAEGGFPPEIRCLE
jgi:hypothetical protein